MGSLVRWRRRRQSKECQLTGGGYFTSHTSPPQCWPKFPGKLCWPKLTIDSQENSRKPIEYTQEFLLILTRIHRNVDQCWPKLTNNDAQENLRKPTNPQAFPLILTHPHRNVDQSFQFFKVNSTCFPGEKCPFLQVFLGKNAHLLQVFLEAKVSPLFALTFYLPDLPHHYYFHSFQSFS